MKTKTKKQASKPIKLDLSFGDLPADLGFTKIQGLDPEKLPWNLPDESVEEAYCAFRFNRIPGEKRMKWMAELWRVLVPEGKCTVIVPYWGSPRSIQDPESQWPPLSEQSFLYFNKNFRDVNKIPQNGSGYLDYDFVYGYTLDPETAGKSDDARPFWIKHYINSVQDLQVTLTKRPK